MNSIMTEDINKEAVCGGGKNPIQGTIEEVYQ